MTELKRIESIEDLRDYITDTRETVFSKLLMECCSGDLLKDSLTLHQYERIARRLDNLMETFKLLEDDLKKFNKK